LSLLAPSAAATFCRHGLCRKRFAFARHLFLASEYVTPNFTPVKLLDLRTVPISSARFDCLG